MRIKYYSDADALDIRVGDGNKSLKFIQVNKMHLEGIERRAKAHLIFTILTII